MVDTRIKSPAVKRYLRRFIPTMIAYVAVIFAVSWIFRTFDPTGPLAWALAVLPAIPILVVIAVMGLYMKEEGDEFVRNLLVESMLWGMGLTLSVMTVWGFAEIYAEAPKLPSFWAFPIFCFGMGVAQPLVKRRFQ
jgi:uncharacterized YccA/Bax inhibitor family protein